MATSFSMYSVAPPGRIVSRTVICGLVPWNSLRDCGVWPASAGVKYLYHSMVAGACVFAGPDGLSRPPQAASARGSSPAPRPASAARRVGLAGVALIDPGLACGTRAAVAD